MGDGHKLLLKMVKKAYPKDGSTSGDRNEHFAEEYLGFGHEHSMVFQASILAKIEIPEFQTGIARGNKPNGSTFSSLGCSNKLT